ncbi:MAG: AAA family ATPase [Candidatus Micrarchaeota archaeon]|nr:AAA family ATPase [Candidatus Micrarchaeota archaeon]MDE1847783.1 AAA family ATPase [Candidatus Micrarchaeota archaeon]MDE1864221.1 AAA family ATPase [Candidatus Micrarchaeota archaeon]
MIICVTGLPGSGKSTVAKLLRKRGFQQVEMRDAVIGRMKQKGMKITPDTVKKYAISVRKKYGKNIVAKYTMQNIVKMHRSKGIAIIGIRSIQEMEFFRKRFEGSIYMVAVVAPVKLRYERLVERGWPNDPHSFAKFEEREKQEMIGYAKNGKKSEGVIGLIDTADYLVCNTETFMKLSKDMNRLLAKIRAIKK